MQFWDEARFGELWSWLFGSACCSCTVLLYGPVNGRWGSVVVKNSQGRSALKRSISCTVTPAATAFRPLLVRQFATCPLRMHYYDVLYRAQERGQPLTRWFVVKNPLGPILCVEVSEGRLGMYPCDGLLRHLLPVGGRDPRIRQQIGIRFR